MAAASGSSHVIRNVPVSFPFTPYSCQLLYMDKVIQALQERTNAILESPTGTGKTLCLLCATLGWREQVISKMKDQMVTRAEAEPGSPWEESTSTNFVPPKIIYSSRTHSQLAQAMQELKNTSYKPKVAIVGSREQLCIHPDVKKKESNSEKVHSCRALVASRTCGYYRNVDTSKLSIGPEAVMDIEELVSVGQSKRMCPYYLARELKSEAELIFMPYNYILDVKIRQLHGIAIENTIVILDEAHNIESICEDSSSFELTTTDISHCIQDVDHLLKEITEEVTLSLNELDKETEDKLKYLSNLKELFLLLESTLDSIVLDDKTNEITKPGSYIFEYFGAAGLNYQTFGTFLEQCNQAISTISSQQSIYRSVTYLQKMVDAVKIVFTTSCPFGMTREKMASLHYKVYIKVDEEKKKQVDLWSSFNATKNKDIARKLCFWCFNPGHSMCELQREGVQSIILTSGTLSPLSSFSSELQLDFPISLQGSHVISPDQVWIGVVSKGCDGTRLNSSYQNRSTKSYMDSLGNTLVNFTRIIPDGMLVFFPSYVVMETLITHWQSGNIYSRIEQYKKIFKEPRRKVEFNDVMEAFYERINDSKSNSAAFFAVCRGKVSEGLDFVDANGRAVVITGLPYPPRSDPKVKLKMEYLQDMKMCQGSNVLNNEEWYSQQSSRAVNQAIGRVIRHKNDYGAIILCDERFSYGKNQSEFPNWLKPSIRKYDKFGQAQKDIIDFFRFAQSRYGAGSSTVKLTKPRSLSGFTEQVKTSEKWKTMKGIQLTNFDDKDIKHDFPSVKTSEKRKKVKGIQYIDFDDKDIKHDFPSASLAKIKEITSTDRNIDLLSSLDTSEAKPVQSQFVGRNLLNFKATPFINQTNRVEEVMTTPITKHRKVDEEKIPLKKIEPTTQINFVMELKGYFSNESFKKFKMSIKEYHETNDIEILLNSLGQIFHRQSSYIFLEGMIKYIKPDHRSQYFDFFLEHTTMPHPLHAPPTKRSCDNEDNNLQQPLIKTQKLDIM